eukprot:SAG31_NODE_4937_length_2850_cov_1.979644_3_plen_654_part_01
MEPESQGAAPGDAGGVSSARERRTAVDAACASPPSPLQQLGLLETRPTVCFGANFDWHQCGQDPGTIGHADVPCLGAASRIYAMTPAWADAIRSGWAEQFAGHARPLRKELLEPGVGLCEAFRWRLRQYYKAPTLAKRKRARDEDVCVGCGDAADAACRKRKAWSAGHARKVGQGFRVVGSATKVGLIQIDGLMCCNSERCKRARTQMAPQMTPQTPATAVAGGSGDSAHTQRVSLDNNKRSCLSFDSDKSSCSAPPLTRTRSATARADIEEHLPKSAHELKSTLAEKLPAAALAELANVVAETVAAERQKAKRALHLARMYKSRSSERLDEKKNMQQHMQSGDRLHHLKSGQGTLPSTRDAAVELAASGQTTFSNAFKAQVTVHTFGGGCVVPDAIQSSSDLARRAMCERAEMLRLQQAHDISEHLAQTSIPYPANYVHYCTQERSGSTPLLARDEVKGTFTSTPDESPDSYYTCVLEPAHSFLHDLKVRVPDPNDYDVDEIVSDEADTMAELSRSVATWVRSVAATAIAALFPQPPQPAAALAGAMDSTTHHNGREETTVNLCGYAPYANGRGELLQIMESFDGQSGPRPEILNLLVTLANIRSRQTVLGIAFEHHLYLLDIPVWLGDNCNGNRGWKNGALVIIDVIRRLEY